MQIVHLNWYGLGDYVSGENVRNKKNHGCITFLLSQRSIGMFRVGRKNRTLGVWNVPYVSGCYLINGSVIANTETRPSYAFDSLDPDMAFCSNMREKDIFMFVSNRMDFGHLVNADNFDTDKTNSEIYQLFDNRWDWEQRYIHENYSENLNPNHTAEQPCPDVYWFPIVTPRFCKEFIEIMEAFGQWSDGTNEVS
uniref:Uncharacterized protein n=1 Tax=Timema douglasi TaxID=61478 RepID=A0A7R8VDX8_TIMDO|nr:unnamed protein product [Timema douglasi]